MDTLSSLFDRCLHVPYVSTPNGGNYAAERRGGTLYLYFEPSNGKEDWKNNLDFPARPYCRMAACWYCHRGFARVWHGMRDEVAATADEALKTGARRITLVGYSHGAALCLLATEDVLFHHPGVPVCGYGFGGPRVIWGRVPGEVQCRMGRYLLIRDGRDLVTHLPPFVLGYRHPYPVLQIGDLSIGRIDAHRPENYAAALRALENRVNKL